ncbi:MAG: glycosyltransferase [Bacteroidales bacterium]|nr:glycosyltransferase [Bacteroidales bacterium]
MKRAIVSVINDLVTDQRVDKTCSYLCAKNVDVLLVGRQKRDSLPMPDRAYRTHRMKLFFEKGMFFYAEYNIRLFLFLLFHKSDLLVSNDLDTLLPNYIISKIKSKSLVYDSHEYFTEVPELVQRKNTQAFWKKIEDFIFPKLKDIITVNGSIADLYNKEYDKNLFVVRNIPNEKTIGELPDRKTLGLPEDKNLIILQGSGINIQRGAEEAVEAMQYVDDAILMIIGGGDVIHILKENVIKLGIEQKVWFFDKMPYNKLIAYTKLADLGLTLDKDTNINYRFSLPNKLFDYIRVGTPILASRLVEIEKIITHYNIGDFIDTHNPRHIGEKINAIFSNPTQLKQWQMNLKVASRELSWENESEILNQVYEKHI